MRGNLINNVDVDGKQSSKDTLNLKEKELKALEYELMDAKELEKLLLKELEMLDNDSAKNKTEDSLSSSSKLTDKENWYFTPKDYSNLLKNKKDLTH